MSKTWRQVIADYRRAEAGRSVYARVYVAGSHRARYTPRVNRHNRVKVLADAGPTAFVRNRFYEMDKWYKARIHKPFIEPVAYEIDPDLPQYKMTLEERLAEERAAEAPTHSVNIGFRLPPSHSAPLRQSAEERARLEKMARHRTLAIDVEAVLRESTCGDSCVAAMHIAKHYSVMEHLFNEYVYFHPVLPMSVTFGDCPVYQGNVVPANEMAAAPTVSYDTRSDALWTLLMVNLDGNPYEQSGNLLHWLVCNVPGCDVASGDTLVPYLQPLPLRGTGWHRLAFVLFAQDGRVDSQHLNDTFACADSNLPLEQRVVDTYSLYKDMEDTLTPAGLAFCHSEWDDSVQRVFHHVLGIEQPMYKFDWPDPKFPQQEEFPKEPQPFNLYMDKYRDPLEVDERLVKERLRRTTVAHGGPHKPALGNVDWHQQRRRLASWHLLEKQKENVAIGKYRALYENEIE